MEVEEFRGVLWVRVWWRKKRDFGREFLSC